MMKTSLQTALDAITENQKCTVIVPVDPNVVVSTLDISLLDVMKYQLEKQAKGNKYLLSALEKCQVKDEGYTLLFQEDEEAMAMNDYLRVLFISFGESKQVQYQHTGRMVTIWGTDWVNKMKLETILVEEFKKCGTVNSVRHTNVAKLAPQTYVEMSNEAEAREVVRVYDNFVIGGTSVRLTTVHEKRQENAESLYEGTCGTHMPLCEFCGSEVLESTIVHIRHCPSYLGLHLKSMSQYKKKVSSDWTLSDAVVGDERTRRLFELLKPLTQYLHSFRLGCPIPESLRVGFGAAFDETKTLVVGSPTTCVPKAVVEEILDTFDWVDSYTVYRLLLPHLKVWLDTLSVRFMGIFSSSKKKDDVYECRISLWDYCLKRFSSVDERPVVTEMDVVEKLKSMGISADLMHFVEMLEDVIPKDGLTLIDEDRGGRTFVIDRYTVVDVLLSNFSSFLSDVPVIVVNEGWDVNKEVGLPQTWEETGLDMNVWGEPLRVNDFKSPTTTQALLLPPILQGRNLIGLAPTGTGKTGVLFAVYQRLLGLISPSTGLMPDGVLVIMLAPTKVLAEQNLEKAKAYLSRNRDNWMHYFRFGLITGKRPKAETKMFAQNPPHFISACLGRLMTFLDENPNLTKVQVIIGDEMDKLLGDPAFNSQLKRLRDRVDLGRQRCHQSQKIFVSATINKSTIQLANDLTQGSGETTVIEAPRCQKNIQKRVVVIPSTEQTNDSLYWMSILYVIFERWLEEYRPKFPGRMMVFVSKTKYLNYIVRLVAEFSKKNRRLLQDVTFDVDEFKLSSSPTKLLFCMDACSRGLDDPRLEVVCRFDIPVEDPVSTITQCVGRVGRAGRTGTALLFMMDFQYDTFSMLQEDGSLNDIVPLRRNEVCVLPGYSSTPPLVVSGEDEEEGVEEAKVPPLFVDLPSLPSVSQYILGHQEKEMAHKMNLVHLNKIVGLLKH